MHFVHPESVRGRTRQGSSIVVEGPTEELRARLLRSVRRYCPAWMADHCEDITQAALIRVLATERASDPSREINATYLDRVAYGCTVDEIRRQRRAAAATGEPLVDEPAGDPAHGPEARAEAARIGQSILDCMQTLVPPRRRAVTLHLVGHTAPAIGDMLGWSTKKTESLIYRGLGNLRDCLSSKGLKP
jgi:RNA polymerase sigma-70 factor (ECF subfamily)